jgi:LPLT family lysophospholipid transporter-like MFS transporter
MQKWPHGFFALLGAQFFSSWADNALLIVAIAQLLQAGQPAWTVPLLKCLFTVAYVALAPWVGASADGWPKTRIMWVSHALKLGGVLAMLTGLDTLGAYALVGVGAALYSPAKYGWITQSVRPGQLVRANGWIETLTVCSAIGGVACGGWWISSGFAEMSWSRSMMAVLAMNAQQLPVAWVGALYGVTLLLTLAVPPDGSPVQSGVGWHLRIVHFFRHDWWVLWSDRAARTSLCVTTLFWGVGASMQLLVLDWAQQRLGLSLEGGAYLQGMTGVGVVMGAWWAGHRIALHQHRRVLVCGCLLAGMLPLMLWVGDWRWALPLTVAVGALSGLLVVPMNAMLQHRGMQVLSAGRSIAVQNFNENVSILIMLGSYALMVGGQWPLGAILGVYACCMLALTGYFMIFDHPSETAPGPSTSDPLR